MPCVPFPHLSSWILHSPASACSPPPPFWLFDQSPAGAWTSQLCLLSWFKSLKLRLLFSPLNCRVLVCLLSHPTPYPCHSDCNTSFFTPTMKLHISVTDLCPKQSTGLRIFSSNLWTTVIKCANEPSINVVPLSKLYKQCRNNESDVHCTSVTEAWGASVLRTGNYLWI